LEECRCAPEALALALRAPAARAAPAPILTAVARATILALGLHASMLAVARAAVLARGLHANTTAVKNQSSSWHRKRMRRPRRSRESARGRCATTAQIPHTASPHPPPALSAGPVPSPQESNEQPAAQLGPAEGQQVGHRRLLFLAAKWRCKQLRSSCSLRPPDQNNRVSGCPACHAVVLGRGGRGR
jgi:hypothetical protein